MENLFSDKKICLVHANDSHNIPRSQGSYHMSYLRIIVEKMNFADIIRKIFFLGNRFDFYVNSI